MNFKPEFIKNLSNSIAEAERKDFYPNQSRNKIIPKTSGKPPLTELPKEKSFYEALISIHGLQEFSDFVLRKIESKSMVSPKSGSEKAIAMNMNNGALSTEQKTLMEKELESLELDEFKLMNLFKEIYAEVFEFKIYELFEIYEMKPNSRLGFKEIYLIITFTAACESFQVLEYLYLFGSLLFNYLSCGNTVAYGVRFRQFAKLIGFPERTISKYMKELEIFDNKEHNLEDFEILMFALFEEKDSTAPESPEKNLKSNQGGNNNKKEGGKYKTCKGLCIIF